MTTYNELQAGMYTAMGYPNNATDGNFVWTAAVPSAAVIAAVEAIPQSTANALYSLTLATNEEAQTLQALITQAQWDALLLWQRRKCAEACGTALNADPLYQWAREKLVLEQGSPVSAKNAANTALSAAGLCVSIS